MPSFRRLLNCGLLLSILAVSLNARVQEKPQDPHQSHKTPPQTGPSPAEHYFTDVLLTNQDGREMRLYSDLLKGKVVVINAFFTNCKGSCPVMANSLAAIQDWLGDRLGKDVYLISITVDPETDTPTRMKEYAGRFSAKPGWFFLTGKKQNVDQALRKLGQYVEVREDHLNVMIMGNERTGLWKKAMGLAKPQDLINVLESVLKDQG